jgi:hypothetical protein
MSEQIWQFPSEQTKRLMTGGRKPCRDELHELSKRQDDAADLCRLRQQAVERRLDAIENHPALSPPKAEKRTLDIPSGFTPTPGSALEAMVAKACPECKEHSGGITLCVKHHRETQPKPDSPRVWEGEKLAEVSLAECPPGLFMFDGSLGFKSEYHTYSSASGVNQCDAYVVESGEYFWGGTSDAKVRQGLMVRPLGTISLPTPGEQGGGERPGTWEYLDGLLWARKQDSDHGYSVLGGRNADELIVSGIGYDMARGLVMQHNQQIKAAHASRDAELASLRESERSLARDLCASRENVERTTVERDGFEVECVELHAELARVEGERDEARAALATTNWKAEADRAAKDRDQWKRRAAEAEARSEKWCREYLERNTVANRLILGQWAKDMAQPQVLMQAVEMLRQIQDSRPIGSTNPLIESKIADATTATNQEWRRNVSAVIDWATAQAQLARPATEGREALAEKAYLAYELGTPAYPWSTLNDGHKERWRAVADAMKPLTPAGERGAETRVYLSKTSSGVSVPTERTPPFPPTKP